MLIQTSEGKRCIDDALVLWIVLHGTSGFGWRPHPS
jgi:hypothetical protein